MATALLSIEDIHVDVAGTHVIKGLSMEINKGEVHALMGRNGAGKSTLLNAIIGRDGASDSKKAKAAQRLFSEAGFKSEVIRHFRMAFFSNRSNLLEI